MISQYFISINHLGQSWRYLFAAFGAANSASFWKRGSFRSGSNMESSRSSAGVSAEVVRKVFALLFRRKGSDDFLKARIATERVLAYQSQSRIPRRLHCVGKHAVVQKIYFGASSQSF
jgi:hypothetical protein